MITRKKHPHKTVEHAIQFAMNQGWRYQKPGNSAHAWGRLLCYLDSREGCAMSVWTTPRNPELHAKQMWYEVVTWLYQQHQVTDESLIKQAKFIEIINATLNSRDHVPHREQQKLLRQIKLGEELK